MLQRQFENCVNSNLTPDLMNDVHHTCDNRSDPWRSFCTYLMTLALSWILNCLWNMCSMVT